MSENIHDSKLVIIEVLRSITGIKYYVFHGNSQFVIIFFSEQKFQSVYETMSNMSMQV